MEAGMIMYFFCYEFFLRHKVLRRKQKRVKKNNDTIRNKRLYEQKPTNKGISNLIRLRGGVDHSTRCCLRSCVSSAGPPECIWTSCVVPWANPLCKRRHQRVSRWWIRRRSCVLLDSAPSRLPADLRGRHGRVHRLRLHAAAHHGHPALLRGRPMTGGVPAVRPAGSRLRPSTRLLRWEVVSDRVEAELLSFLFFLLYRKSALWTSCSRSRWTIVLLRDCFSPHLVWTALEAWP